MGPSGHTPRVLGEGLAFPGYVASWMHLGSLGCWLREGSEDETWILNISFSSLSLIVSKSKACTCLSLSRCRLSMFSGQSK